jgi:uncharacterized OsmC-like protein
MVESASHYLLTLQRSPEKEEERVTQRHEKVRYAKRHPYGINPMTRLEMGVVSCMVAYLLAHKQRKDAKLFAKATEEELRPDNLLLMSMRYFNRDSILNIGTMVWGV